MYVRIYFNHLELFFITCSERYIATGIERSRYQRYVESLKTKNNNKGNKAIDSGMKKNRNNNVSKFILNVL